MDDQDAVFNGASIAAFHLVGALTQLLTAKGVISPLEADRLFDSALGALEQQSRTPATASARQLLEHAARLLQEVGPAPPASPQGS